MILFCKTTGPYGCFSNFSRDPVFIWGHHFMTSEHAYQAAKMLKQNPDTYDLPSGEHFDMIRTASSPSQAAKLGRNKSFPMRKDWEDEDSRMPDIVIPDYPFTHKEKQIWRVKDWIMFDVCFQKFYQNDSAKQILLGTKDVPLIEDTSMSHDHYWGIDFSGNPVGENKLGRVLMLVREKLRDIS